MDWSGRSSAKHLTILKMKEDREAVDGFVLFLTEPLCREGGEAPQKVSRGE